MTTFNGVLQSHTFDHGKAAFYREQERARQEREAVERANHWLGLRLSGQTFTSLKELQDAARDVVLSEYEGISDETQSIITKAVTLLWLGKVEWALFREPRVRATTTENPHTVTFAA